jgi:hypothetical protein
MSATSVSWGALAATLLAGSIAAADPIVVTPMPVPAPPPPAETVMTPDGMTPPAPQAATKVVTPGPRRALAVAANTAGLRFHRSGQVPRAAMRFRDATLLDPDYALAHYNLACAASRLRDVATAVSELLWLAHAADPVAQVKLHKAQTDPDIDFASSLPKARGVLGLPPFDAQHPLAWLSERHGTWSAELPTDDCATRSYTLVFEADGAAHLIVHEACARASSSSRRHGSRHARAAAPGVAHTYDGSTVLATDGKLKLEITGWPLWPGGVQLAFGACPGLTDAPGSCFVLINGDEEVGPFHRGLAGTSPMRNRADVAALK